MGQGKSLLCMRFFSEVMQIPTEFPKNLFIVYMVVVVVVVVRFFVVEVSIVVVVE